MKNIFFAFLMLVSTHTLKAETKPLNVVSTFSILGDIVKTIGGKHVKVQSLVGPNIDVHAYNPTPQDGVTLHKADLVFMSGLGLEGWLHQFVKGSGFKGDIITASKGIDPIVESVSSSGEKVYDPHVWHSLDNIVFYAKNITAALKAKDPMHAENYMQNEAGFLKEVAKTKAWAKDMFGRIPCENRTVITVHDAFQYLGKEFGLQFLAPFGINPEAQPAPKDLAKLLGQIKQYKVRSIFLEPIINTSVVKQIAREAGIKVGATLYADALSEEGGVADNYLKLMRHNLSHIAKGMCP